MSIPKKLDQNTPGHTLQTEIKMAKDNGNANEIKIKSENAIEEDKNYKSDVDNEVPEEK